MSGTAASATPPQEVDQHPLLSFLATQPPTALTRLYTKPSSCLCIFRLLGPFERQIVMNLLWMESPMPPGMLGAWVLKEGKIEYEKSLGVLSTLQILQTVNAKLILNPQFKSNFRLALTGGGDHASFGVPCEREDKRSTTIEQLDQYAIERWETILHYMVSSGTDQAPPKPSQGVLYLLSRSGLMTGTGVMKITSQGFQFLLNSPHAQLWSLLLEYLKLVEDRQMDLVEVVHFLFMLSTMELGQDYSTEHLTQSQEAMLEDLRDYGLVLQRKATSKRIHPTRLATTLTSSAPPLISTASDGSVPSRGFIILETNYRLYAYTDNPLQTAVLNLFVNLKSRFPNLVTGLITRESVKRALSNGITAEQIISYLVTHAHPQMHKNNPLLPITVQDQIRLWEQENNRVHLNDGYLWRDFTSFSDYEIVRNYARQIGVVLWENPEKRWMFLTAEGHVSCRSFIERRQREK
ncbi:RNA polymerase II transcription factor B 52 kDa subunit [Tulasnella sp. 418]|nr:RNA polymerase II transcription factor B 52 kDa subunit [Tulasnella sp. 418]